LLSEKFVEDYWIKKIKSLLETNPGQMSESEYVIVLQAILFRAPCKLLIFGIGKDSEMWQEANKGGLTVFLEHNAEWIQFFRNAITIQISYRTSLLEKWKYKPIDNIPLWINDTPWDIVLVDAPEGYESHLPGRLSSIKVASVVCKNGVVFVHDMQRDNEKDFTMRYLGQPTKIIESLGVWRRNRLQNFKNRCFSEIKLFMKIVGFK